MGVFFQYPAFARISRTSLLLALGGLGACVDKAAPLDYGDPTSLHSPTSEGGITAYLVSPGVLDVFSVPDAQLVIAAFADQPGTELDVRVTDPDGNVRSAVASGAPGPDQRFSVPVPLLHGKNRLQIRA